MRNNTYMKEYMKELFLQPPCPLVSPITYSLLSFSRNSSVRICRNQANVRRALFMGRRISRSNHRWWKYLFTSGAYTRKHETLVCHSVSADFSLAVIMIVFCSCCWLYSTICQCSTQQRDVESFAWILHANDYYQSFITFFIYSYEWIIIFLYFALL